MTERDRATVSGDVLVAGDDEPPWSLGRRRTLQLAAAVVAAAHRWRVYAGAGAGPAQSRVAQVAHRGFHLLAQQVRR